jgi:hypothetical protein
VILCVQNSTRRIYFADFADSARVWRSLTLHRPQTYPRNRSGVPLHEYRCDSTNLGCRRYCVNPISFLRGPEPAVCLIIRSNSGAPGSLPCLAMPRVESGANGARYALRLVRQPFRRNAGVGRDCRVAKAGIILRSGATFNSASLRRRADRSTDRSNERCRLQRAQLRCRCSSQPEWL